MVPRSTRTGVRPEERDTREERDEYYTEQDEQSQAHQRRMKFVHVFLHVSLYIIVAHIVTLGYIIYRTMFLYSNQEKTFFMCH